MDNKEKILRAFIEEKSNYKITVSDSSMLPDSMKNKKEVIFTIKPPVLAILIKCAIPLGKIPKELLEPEKPVNFEVACHYSNEMAEAFSILAHGKQSAPPAWHVPFILNNITAKELFMLFKEVAMKTQSSFFLSSFQIANISNPITAKQTPLES